MFLIFYQTIRRSSGNLEQNFFAYDNKKSLMLKFFLCWSSLGGHLFWTPSMSYISVNVTCYNYRFMPLCGLLWVIELCSLKCGEKVREKREREKEVSDNCMDIVWCWLSNLYIMRIFEWWETQCFKWNQRNWWHLWLQRTNISCLAKCTFHQRHVDDWKKDN